MPVFALLLADAILLWSVSASFAVPLTINRWAGVIMFALEHGNGNPTGIPWITRIHTNFFTPACLWAEICAPLRYSTITDITF